MKRFLLLTFFLTLLGGATWILTQYYSYIFSKQVDGEVVGIDRVMQPSTVVGLGVPIPSAQMFSFAIAIKTASGEIFTASSEDRQWAVVEKGQCADARFYPYAPWILDKSGTYFGARLLSLHECGTVKK